MSDQAYFFERVGANMGWIAGPEARANGDAVRYLSTLGFQERRRVLQSALAFTKADLSLAEVLELYDLLLQVQAGRLSTPEIQECGLWGNVGNAWARLSHESRERLKALYYASRQGIATFSSHD